MDLTPEQMGLQNPWSGAGPGGPESGAINPDSAGPPDVMEAPAYAATETDISRAIQAAVSSPAVPATTAQPSWLQANPNTGTTTPATSPVTQTGQVNWDSDANPYKREAQANRPDPVRNIQAQLAQIPAYTQQAVQVLMANGYDAAHAAQLANAGALAASADLRAQMAEAVTLPAAEQMVAEDIARRVSIPGVVIDPKELRGERTPGAMMARARTLVEVRRTQASQQRATSRVDTVEAPVGIGSGSTGARTTESPFQMIKSGLASQRNR